MNDTTSQDPALDTPPAPPTRSTRLLAVGVLVIVALAGVIGGVALDRFLLHPQRWGSRLNGGDARPEARRPSAHLPAELKLTEQQAARIDTLFDRQMQGFRAIRKSTQPAIDSLVAQTRRAMDSVLTPAQRAVMDSTRAKREAEFKKRFPNGAPRGPGEWGRPPLRP